MFIIVLIVLLMFMVMVVVAMASVRVTGAAMETVKAARPAADWETVAGAAAAALEAVSGGGVRWKRTLACDNEPGLSR